MGYHLLPNNRFSMPSKKVPLARSPLGQMPIENRTYEESFDLLAAAPGSTQYQPLSTPKYDSSGSGKSLNSLDSPSPRLPPLPPSKGQRLKRQRSDPEALPLFASHSETSHRSLSPMEVGTMQTVKDMEMEDMDYYMPPKRRCPRGCRWFFASVFLFLCSVAVVLTCLYLIAGPRSPMLQMEVLNVTRFKYDQGVKGGAPYVTAGLKVSLQEANPSKEAELIYDQVRMELSFQGSLLGNFSIPGSKQSKKSNRTFVLELPETSTAIEDPADAVKFRQEMSRKNVQTDLKGAVAGHYKMFGIRVKKFDVPLDCKVNVEPENSGNPARLRTSICYYFPT